MFTISTNVVATDDRIRQQIKAQGFESFRASSGSAAYDLHAILPPSEMDIRIQAHSTVLIDTGLSIHIGNAGFCALVLARSGLASKKQLAPINSPGLIDSDYQGPLKVALHNFSSEDRIIQDFERIAQLLFIPVAAVRGVLVDSHVDATARGAGGFGSTGS